jgi:hypothetical protein
MKRMNALKTAAFVIVAIVVVATVSAGAANNAAKIPVSQVHGVSMATAPKLDLSGKWDLDVKTDNGPVSAKADLKVASDGTISGTIESPEYGSSKISSGSVTDASFAFKFDLNSQGSAISVGMSGTFDEKGMKGSGTAGDTSFTFTGTRSSSAQ